MMLEKERIFKVRFRERHGATAMILFQAGLYSWMFFISSLSGQGTTDGAVPVIFPALPIIAAVCVVATLLFLIYKGFGAWVTRYRLTEDGIALDERTDWGLRTPVSHRLRSWDSIAQVNVSQEGKFCVRFRSGSAIDSYWPVADPGEFEECCANYLKGVHESRKTSAIQAVRAEDAEKKWDFFISHAWEDKDAFVRELAEELILRGCKVWYDEKSLRLGDSIRRSIDLGLARSKYGLVVLSPHSLRKEWARKEVDAMFARETSGQSVILPIWHRVDRSDVEAISPMLADKLAISSDRGVSVVVDMILEAVEPLPGKKI